MELQDATSGRQHHCGRIEMHRCESHSLSTNPVRILMTFSYLTARHWKKVQEQR